MLSPWAITALVLAAQRNGVPGALADRFGVSHKCLVPFGGRPLIEHVLETLSRAAVVREIIVSIEAPEVLADNRLVVGLVRDGRLKIVKSMDTLTGSVATAAGGSQFPMLITTADNVLFTEDALATMIQGAGDAEVAAAFARKGAVLAAHAEGQRRFYEFADDAYSNCNCYWLGSAKALHAADIFKEGGQFSKHPMRIAQAFGFLNLILFRLGMGSLDQMFARFSRRLGVTMRSVIFDDGALAIDVDNEGTYAVAEALMLARQGKTPERLVGA